MDSELKESLDKWWGSDGNNTHAIDHPINENSVVVEIGGFDGSWVARMIRKHNSKYYVLEPVKSFYDNINRRFNSLGNINVIHAGLSSKDETTTIHVNGDGTALHNQNGVAEEIKLWSIDTLLEHIDEDVIDLMQINIEGEEYPLLEELINNDKIGKIKRMQIQFHTFVDDYRNRRLKIQEGLSSRGFKKVYDFPFVFECWEL